MAYDPNKVNLGADLLTNPTASDRDPWQEAFKRFSAVAEASVLRASEAMSGMTGSWAAQYKFGPSVTDNSDQPESTSPSNFSMKCSKLGRPGMPEIDFVPYCHNTNRFGNKGGALLGEPISFQFVGPTPKVGGQNMVWQWVVTAGPVADTLELDDLIVDTSAGPPWSHTTRPVTMDIEALYNIVPATWATRFDGGLYVMITETGYTGEIDPTTPVTGGIGDGALVQDAGIPREPLTPLTSNSKTELFRVTALNIGGSGYLTGFTLDSGKRIEDYFEFNSGGGLDVVRHITLVEPVATRLTAIPDSGAGKGREQVFAFTPPRRALTSEFQMLTSNWITAGALEYPWDEAATVGQDIFDYEYGPSLPVQKPFAEWENVYLTDESVWPLNGPWAVMVIAWDADVSNGDPLPEAGDIIKIHAVHTGDKDLWETSNGRSANWGSLLGYFEVKTVALAAGTVYYVEVRRYVEVNPESGNSMWGLGRMFSNLLVDPYGIQLKCSIHKPVTELWNNPWFDADALDSTRLTNLIDPRWVERNGAISSSSLTERPMGKSPYRPDRAIFDTASSNSGTSGSNADPGNLQNLGFRVVLFPARIKTVPTADGTEDILTPDWNRPITSNEVSIDPTVNAKQYIEVDYANGLVRLSHPPQALAITDPNAGDLAPLEDIFTLGTDDNPRGEMVLFASCVPYTQDIGQRGAGPRITNNTEVLQKGESYDVYGSRTAFDIEVPQTITCYNDVGVTDQQLVLTGLVADQLPPTGFFELFDAGTPVFTTGRVRGSLFGYYGVVETGGNTVLHGVHGGLEVGTDTVTIAVAGQALLRRELYTPNDLYGTAGVSYQNDVSYGSAKRAGTLRFTGVESVVNLDGSITIKIEASGVPGPAGPAGATGATGPVGPAGEGFEELFSSWVFDGGDLTGVWDGLLAYSVDIAATTILFQGSRIVVPLGSLVVGATSSGYIYIDGVTALGVYTYSVSATIPLPDIDHVLLGYYSSTMGTAPVTTDLRYPLLDIDRRLDIFVGNHKTGTDTSLTGYHFTSLADAVAYANEIQNPIAGRPDYRVRIRVVGYTEEVLGDLPILIKTDGLTIESDPSLDADVAISWAADDKALIDLNGHEDLTFDGLNFRSLSTDSANIEPFRAAFINTGGICKRLTINNCRLHGGQGFITMTDNSFEDAIITNNYCEDLLDFGVYLINTAPDPITMTVAGGTTTTIAVTSGVVYVAYGVDIMVLGTLGGTITYTDVLGISTMTITDTAGVYPSISVKPDDAGSAAQVSFEGDGTLNDGTSTIVFSSGDSGMFANYDLAPAADEGIIAVTSSILERSVIENNTFIQASTIGNMADNTRTMGAATATILVGGGMTLRIGDNDGSAAVGAPPTLPGYIDLTNGDTANLTNDGAGTVDIITPGPTTELQITVGEMVAFYASTTGTGGWAVITFPGTDPIQITEDTFGYLLVGATEVDFIHGPNTGATAGGIVLHTELPDGAVSSDFLFASILANMHNDIVHNTIQGFHVGVSANIIWNSRICNNVIEDTKNLGIQMGMMAGYYSINDNVLDSVFTATQLDDEPFQWPAQQNFPPTGSFINAATPPIKYGIYASGFHSEVEKNVIATSSYLSPAGDEEKPTWTFQAIDIYLTGYWLTARDNTSYWCVGGLGYALKFEDNTISYSGFAGLSEDASIFVFSSYSVIRGNSCGGHIYLNGSGSSVVDANVGVLTGIYLANPTLASSIRLGSANCTISNNKVNSISLTGNVNIIYRPNYCSVQGNSCVTLYNGDSFDLVGPTNTRILNNYVSTNIVSYDEATHAIITGNTVLGTIDIFEDYCVVGNNQVAIIDVNATPITNWRRVLISSNNVSNKITGEITLNTTPIYTSVIGNTVPTGGKMFGHTTVGVHTDWEAHNIEW